ncbi:RluA family pseudouridine synthase [Porphyromonas cangingivalis]|uniref:Pseudouridine synthase n=1 Tax=Porphyromonas cangingivalis TaxID=36874 RepID=A0A1T4L127_PORCN|nr:RluA family pseudouridine synthase [Porphyromonas cangingivalis]SJZ48386.1 23S rRNA pseudouridine1911/1915/1917 synthase [Porphyromonas cangingivalis]VEJ03977.1 Ribosomal large subunit pseudouridine synthase D [Porphyromonas cangingivalis]
MTDLNDEHLSDLIDEDGDPTPTELYEHFGITVDKGQQPIRIDKYLVDRMPNVSRNRVQQAADAGVIFVNQKPVKSNYKVKPLDVISLRLERPPYEFEIIPEDIPLNIVYEDDYVMVINKQAGLVVHPGHGNYTGTMLNAIAFHLKDTPEYDPSDPRLGLVHRIDKDTSGLLVIAKTPEVKTHLSAQFFDKTTHRLYEAIVWGSVQEDEGTIRTNLARDPKDRMQMTTFPYEGEVGKTAVTHYRVLERLGYISRIECRLETGRTHQIRAHMKSIGHTLFNDERYGGHEILRGNRFSKYTKFVENSFALCPRQALHAKTLGFYHPILKEEMTFEAPLPSDMVALIEKWRTYVASGNIEPEV